MTTKIPLDNEIITIKISIDNEITIKIPLDMTNDLMTNDKQTYNHFITK